MSLDNLKHKFREQVVVHPPCAKTFNNVLFDRKEWLIYCNSKLPLILLNQLKEASYRETICVCL